MIDKKFIVGMKEKAEPWRSEKVQPEDMFSIVRRYADYL